MSFFRGALAGTGWVMVIRQVEQRLAWGGGHMQVGKMPSGAEASCVADLSASSRLCP